LDGRGGSDRLNGADGDDLLQYSADGQWGLHAFAVHAGRLALAGSEGLAWLAGRNRSYDLFDGGGGFDTLLGTTGPDVLFLHDRISPPDGYNGPRIARVESISSGAGNDVIDLTSRQHVYGDVMLDGGDGNDVLWASAGNDVLSGGRGDDRLSGGAGSDVYVYELDGGRDQITEAGTGTQDVLRFGAGISQHKVTAWRNRADLVLDVAGQRASITINGWFSSSAQRVERIEFADGTHWTEAQIRERVAEAGDDYCEPHRRAGHRDPHDGHRTSWKEHERNRERLHDRDARHQGAVEELIAARLSSLPHFNFEKIVEELDHPVEPVRTPHDVARRWQEIATFASMLGGESGDDIADGALPGWRLTEQLSATGWGFDGSVGDTRDNNAAFKALQGLMEGFRRL
jgi:hypothetical protein